MAKILYLDYDGVLHDSGGLIHPELGIRIETPNSALFEWMPILEDILSPYPDIQIVLSTSWVSTEGFSFAKQQLSQSLQSRVIGATYTSRIMQNDVFHHVLRGHQVILDVERRQPESWFAIDDDPCGWPAWSWGNFIQTNGVLGISCPEVQKEIRSFLKYGEKRPLQQNVEPPVLDRDF